eukprot:TRINITY_DN9480_c0_g1_i1.p1 TRINITY_DN9480_c0_g1~~TRINITY_DN9480_c0_g1_i1.p1  ORF type:complete len:122 (-),score=23.82 TRINITY_DN9480_c0_g1_i1:26-391(-)
MAEGITEAQFFVELERYDKVRENDWQGWHTMARAAPKKQIVNSNTNNNINDSALLASQLDKLQIDNSQDFYTNLKKLLPTLFPGADPDQVLELFKQEQAHVVASLSLDDMERYFSVVNNSK